MTAPAIAPGVPSDYYERIRNVDEESWWYLGSRSIERALLGPWLSKEGLRLLDAGCGPGGYLRWAVESGLFAYVAGVDLGAIAIGIARRRAPTAELHICPLHNLPFDANAFDIVVTHDVLQHIPEADVRGSLEELRRVLDPAGALVIRTNGSSRFGRPRHDWRVYDRHVLRRTIEDAGFRCERLTYANMLPSLFAALKGRSPEAPTEARAGVPRPDTSRLKAAVGRALLRAEARYLARPGRSLPYGHSLWAVAVPATR
jgi:SAM-dependent methyltransferase